MASPSWSLLFALQLPASQPFYLSTYAMIGMGALYNSATMTGEIWMTQRIGSVCRLCTGRGWSAMLEHPFTPLPTPTPPVCPGMDPYASGYLRNFLDGAGIVDLYSAMFVDISVNVDSAGMAHFGIVFPESWGGGRSMGSAPPTVRAVGSLVLPFLAAFAPLPPPCFVAPVEIVSKRLPVV